MNKLTFEQLSAERKALQELGEVPEWYITQGWQMFQSKYQVPGEALGVKSRHKAIAATLVKHLPKDLQTEWEQKFFDILFKGWVSLSTPALANTGTSRGMGVSCSGQYVGDSVDAFYRARHEAAMLSKYGFGCSATFSDIRGRGAPISVGGTASGVVPVIKGFAQDASEISQGSQRRGSIASYLDIEHGDFDELCDLLLASPDGLNIGWTIKDKFIIKLTQNDPEAQRRLQRALYIKLLLGKGYFFFVDKANRARPQMYKDLGLDIKATNLCTEIMLHSSEEHSFSCILASMNLYKYDEWKGTDAIITATVMLDCLASEFIDQSTGIPGLEKVREFTIKGRALGLGVLGFSSYLQKKRIPFEALDAQFLNNEIFKKLHDESLQASKWLAQVLGEPEWCKGYGVRNTHRTAVAPTKSTSILMGGVSESVFPDPGMVFDAGSSVGELRRIVPEFYELMKERGQYTQETIDSIIQHIGSVQHLDWLTPEEKLVFRTAFEVDQRVILRYASQRQMYLCQGQSLNFYIPEDGSEEYFSELMTASILDPFILSQYYVYSRSGVTIAADQCVACEA